MSTPIPRFLADHILNVLRERRDACIAGLNAIDGINVATPNSTFYVFPNVTAIMQRKGLTDVNQLMTEALHQTSTDSPRFAWR